MTPAQEDDGHGSLAAQGELWIRDRGVLAASLAELTLRLIQEAEQHAK